MTTDLAQLERLHRLTIRFYQTPPGKLAEAFTPEEIALLKQAGVIHKPRGRRLTAEDAEIAGRAYTALDR